MKLAAFPLFAVALAALGACGKSTESPYPEQLRREEAERAAALEAAEMEILNGGMALPAEANAGQTPDDKAHGGANDIGAAAQEDPQPRRP